MPILAALWIAVILLLAVAPGVFSPYSPVEIDPANSLRPPAFVAGGSASNLLGTDRAGRDILSRIIFGAQADVLIVATSLAIGGTAGVALGMIAGYARGWKEILVMRAVDVSLALPTVLLVLTAVAVSGPSFWLVVFGSAFVLWARFARLMRSEVVVARERGFVEAAVVVGATPMRILARHILPNVTHTIIVLVTLQIGWIIVIEGSLSFLGAGVPPPSPTWGNMVASGRDNLESAWWVLVAPGLMISFTVLAFNAIGDRLRDRLDPRLRQIA